MRKLALLLATSALSLGTAANAASIVGLVNTGVNPGTPGAADNSWTIDGGPAYAGTPINGAWLANSGVSQWLTPNPDGNVSLDPSLPGIYQYSLTFDLTGFNPASASFSGRFSVDNLVDNITLNGTPITGSGGSFNIWTAFSGSSGFNAGQNTLTFNVRNLAQNGGNPSGLRVEFLESNVTAVPEPATWAMMIMGFGLVGAAARRRQNVRVSFA